MSRKTKIAAVAILALGLTGGAWAVYGGHSEPAKPAVAPVASDEGSVVSPEMPKPEKSVHAAPSAPVAPVAPAKPAQAVGKAVDVTWYKLLAPNDVRPDESSAARELRQQMDAKLTGFFETAKLPEVYQKRTLDTLADMQAEYEALDEQLKAGDAELYKESMRALDRNTVDELARFLSPDQLNDLDNAIGLETLHTFVVAKPFDLKTQPTK